MMSSPDISHPVHHMRWADDHSSDRQQSRATHPLDIINDTIDLTQDPDAEIIHSIHPRRERRNRKLTDFYKPMSDSCSPACAIESKRKTNSSDIANKSRSPKKKKHTQEHNKNCIGSRVAKYFGTQLFLGTITSCDIYYHVLYDDEDEEDFDGEELREGLELYGRMGREFYNNQKTRKGEKRTSSSVKERFHVAPLSVEPARTQKINESKQHSTTFTSPTKSITPKMHKPKVHKHQPPSIGPTLFDLHNVTPTHIDAISQLLGTNHSTHAVLITEFFLFCYERQLVWKRKRSGVLDGENLTKDGKMARNFFCNVYRELDRGTSYFRGNLIRHRTRSNGSHCGAGYNLEEVLWDSICYRLVNKIETFERFGSIPYRREWNAFVHGTLKPLWKGYDIVFTGAHQTIGRDRYLDTMNSLCENDGAFLKELAGQISRAADLRTCYNTVLRVRNVGNFLAWQVICDLMEARVVRFAEDEWVKLGPGAINGLKVIFGDSLKKGPELLKKAVFLRVIQSHVYQAMEITFPRFIGRDMTLKNIEHALCEFCKYKNGSVTRKFDLDGHGSRSHLDFSKGCQVCNVSLGRSLFKLCDLCRSGYCGCCSADRGEAAGDAWLCSHCIQIEYQRGDGNSCIVRTRE
ncbi:hypothetical protein ACHAW6_011682 [Cyclotella cf. meneghiniana]